MVDIQSGKTGEHDTRISVIASDAEHTVFLKKGSFASRKTDDMLLLQETERALADKSSPKVIFLHMIGSHRIRVTDLTLVESLHGAVSPKDCLLPRQHQ